MEQYAVYFALVCAAAAVAYGLISASWILRLPQGSDRMRQIAAAIQEGAGAYMKRQYTIIAMVGVVMFVILFPRHPRRKNRHRLRHWRPLLRSDRFHRHVRLGQGQCPNHRSSQSPAFTKRSMSHSEAAPSPACWLSDSACSVLPATTWFCSNLMPDEPLKDVVSQLVGLGFGGSLISIFARLGGGIFTKGADVGADLVGKVEAGIPEDDPRNPAVIADNVGDNVGDCAGMAADLFETYAVTLIAAMLLGAITFTGNASAVNYPLILGGISIIASIIGTFFVKLGSRRQDHGRPLQGTDRPPGSSPASPSISSPCRCSPGD